MRVAAFRRAERRAAGGGPADASERSKWSNRRSQFMIQKGIIKYNPIVCLSFIWSVLFCSKSELRIPRLVPQQCKAGWSCHLMVRPQSLLSLLPRAAHFAIRKAKKRRKVLVFTCERVAQPCAYSLTIACSAIHTLCTFNVIAS